MLAHFARRLRQRQTEGSGDTGDTGGVEGMILGEGGETILIDDNCTVRTPAFAQMACPATWLIYVADNVTVDVVSCEYWLAKAGSTTMHTCLAVFMCVHLAKHSA